jgi:transcriptional regulator with XRE-family HTH domain
MMTHTDMVNQMLQNPQVKAEYEALEPEFALLDELLRARQRAGLTPAEVAQRIGTPLRVITRLETGISEKYSPSVTTLRKYAEAVGCRLEIKLVPR